MVKYSKMIQNPSYAELQKAGNQCRRCTWEKLSVRANCAIELALDECVALLNHLRWLNRSAGICLTRTWSYNQALPIQENYILESHCKSKFDWFASRRNDHISYTYKSSRT